MNSSVLQLMDKTDADRTDMGGYSQDFQLSIIRYYLSDTHFLQTIRSVFDPEYFTYNYLKGLATFARGYIDTYKKIPSIEEIKELIGISASLTPEVRSDMLIALDRMPTLEIGKDFVQSETVKFFRQMEMFKAFSKSMEIMKGGYPEDGYKEIFDLVKSAYVSCTPSNTFHDYVKDAMVRYPDPQSMLRTLASTGFYELDALTQGGIGSGQMGVVTAGTGVGKSHFLTQIGFANLNVGKKVWHVTLELSNIDTGKRYDSRAINVPYDALYDNKELVYEQIQKLKGSLMLLEYPSYKLTIDTLYGDYERLKLMEFIPDVVIVDYPDLLLGSQKLRSYSNESMYNALGVIYSNLRDFGKELGVPVWVASQINRAGIKDGGKSEDLSDMADSMKKGHFADVIVALQRTQEMKDMNRALLRIKKNRRGPDGIAIPLRNVDFSRSYMEVDSEQFFSEIDNKTQDVINRANIPEAKTLAEAIRRGNSVVINYAENLKKNRDNIKLYNEANSVLKSLVGKEVV